MCDLAESLHIHQALVPAHTGVLSALGLLAAPSGKEVSQSRIQLLDACEAKELVDVFARLELRIAADLEAESTSSYALKRELDLRYQGQSTTLRLPWQDPSRAGQAFHERHRERYGYALDMPVELVNLRLTATATDTPELPLPRITRSQPGAPTGMTHLHEHAKEVPVFNRSDLARDQTLCGPVIVVEPQATLYIAPNWTASQQDSGSLLLEHAGCPGRP